MFKRIIMCTVVCMCAAMVAVTGCKSDSNTPKGEVELVYVEWACATAATNVMKAVLEKANYRVKITPVSAAAMWSATSSGDVEGFVCAWLPGTHGNYLKQVKGKVEDLGPNMTGAKIGLVVPKYVTINSITELKANKDKFNGKIIGIDPGAGIMSAAEKAIKEYGIGFKLIEGSGATMTASLADAVKKQQWIVVTGWAPHWKFARWELKFLEDPKGVFGGAETINTVVRVGLKKDMPEVYDILNKFQISSEDLHTIMLWNTEDNADVYKNAKKWVEQNSSKVSQWL
ncbi:MAG TPA: glycine betaine ABC transporter substrate-binding protein [Spirochaetota bacterium]|nr:glycine betaine ABC transporter substrate-binding protein [Spirochaetota bacterium]HPJ38116.1 glycine betaine ABC transporter substrate-binding protein [Spirochaetota bacterium]HPQ54206.1 glycine betaine ABC transporter substrate-binding protein [Spirochaetota bacterium]